MGLYPRTNALNGGTPDNPRYFGNGSIIIGYKLLLFTQRNSHTGFRGLYEFASNGICKYRNLAVNQLSWNLQVLEFEGKI